MKILLLHSDFIEWEPKRKAIAKAEKADRKPVRVTDALAVFSSVEKPDEKDPEQVASNTAREILKVFGEVKAKAVVLYPYVHLSQEPSSPDTALRVLNSIESQLRKSGKKVYRAPFGWYKAFTIKVKGHPLSELSRSISPGSGEHSDSMEARMETASHLVFDTTRKITGQKYISISETSNNSSVLHWKELKFQIDDDLIKKIQKEVNKNLSSDMSVRIETLSRSEALERCGKIFEKAVPRNLKRLRVVSIGDLPPEPCNNPHVSNTRKIGNKISIVGYKKIDKDKADISISVSSDKDDDTSEALKKEKSLKSSFFIFTPDGRKHPIRVEAGKVKGFNFSGHPNLEKMVNYDLMKDRRVLKEPPHIAIMKRLELFDYEPGSDPGNFRCYPNGKMVKDLIETWTTRKTIEYGAMEVETPVMYDYEHPSLKDYLNRFPARQYTIETPNKRVFLRFSACFGQFLMKKDASISYRNLPLRLYELTRYSFRVEQRGELAGLRRLRAFTMPDCHAACSDMEQAKEEMLRRFRLCGDVLGGFGLTKKNDIELAIRVVKDFYDKNRDYVHGMVKKFGKPVLVEIWDRQFFYFIFKHEWNFVDALGKAATLSTDQIDIENAQRYGIQYTDRDNTRKYPIILHCSPSGAIERVLYALLEKEYMKQQAGGNPMLPLWLSPTQVRLCPVNDGMIPYCNRLADKLEKENIRVDVDDRVESVSKKVREAEVEWVPYSIVVGKKEKSSGKLPLRFRRDGKVRSLSLAGVVKEIRSQTEGLPYRPLPMDRLLTKRPIFFG